MNHWRVVSAKTEGRPNELVVVRLQNGPTQYSKHRSSCSGLGRKDTLIALQRRLASIHLLPKPLLDRSILSILQDSQSFLDRQLPRLFLRLSTFGIETGILRFLLVMRTVKELVNVEMEPCSPLTDSTSGRD